LAWVREFDEERGRRDGVDDAGGTNQHAEQEELFECTAEDLAREAAYHDHVAQHHTGASTVFVGYPGCGEERCDAAERVGGRKKSETRGGIEAMDVPEPVRVGD
jgi:hypothetical protein